jgi:hypothetical protein
MPVHQDFHPEYLARTEQMTKCRDAFEGQEAIHKAGIKYLPKLTGQSQSAYNAYKKRALFYAITSKSISSMVGMATQKEPIIVRPDVLKPYLEDDNSIEFYELYTILLTENLLQGRIGCYIDRPIAGGKLKANIYLTENIVNWETDDNGDPTLVVLRETIFERDQRDRFKSVTSTQYRVLEMVDGRFQVQLYDSKGVAIGGVMVPNIRGVAITFIPFFVVGPSGLGWRVEKSPTIDIVNINLSHYLSSADLEHGRHFTSLPTPVAIGVEASAKLNIGSMTAWILPIGGDAKFLEFTGQGLGSLEKALVEKQSQLASLAARMLDNSKRGSEAAETVKLRYMSESATLSAVVRATESMLNRVYSTMAVLEGELATSVSIKLDKDFIDSKLSATELTALANAYLTGAMDKETYIYNLRSGNRLNPARTNEEVMAAIKEPQPKEDVKTVTDVEVEA